MGYTSDGYTETNGTMEEISKRIKNAHTLKYGGTKKLSDDMERRMKGLYERRTDPSDPDRPTFEEFVDSLPISQAMKDLQAPEELPEGQGRPEGEEPPEVEEQEPPGNVHENEPDVMEDGTPEPPEPKELTSQEMNQDPLEVLGEDEQKEYMDEMMARDGNEYADQEDDPLKQIEKSSGSNSSLARAAKFQKFRQLASPDPQATWDGVTKGATHKITACMDAMKGEVDDPGAFCGWLAKQVGYEPER